MLKSLKHLVVTALGCGALLFLGTSFLHTVSLAVADDGDGVIEDTYIAPLDENGSDESVREQGSSGFDTPGPVTVQPDYYDAQQDDSSSSDTDSEDSGN